MMRSGLFLLLLMTVLAGCNRPGQTAGTQASEPPGEVVLISVDRPGKWRQYWHGEGGPYSPMEVVLSWRDDDGIRREWRPGERSDTLVIPTERPLVEITHTNRAIDPLRFYLESGDTAVFTYPEKTPVAAIVNRKESPEITNLDLTFRRRIYGGDFPDDIKLTQPFAFVDFSKAAPPDFQKIVDQFVAETAGKALDGLDRQAQFLDSLYQNELVFDPVYTIRSRILRVQKNALLADERIRSMVPEEEAPVILDSYAIYFETLARAISAKKDREFRDGIPVIKTPNGSYQDFRILYDRVGESQDFKPWELKYLLRETLEGIVVNFPATDIEQYFSKHLAGLRDTVFVDYLKEKYRIDLASREDLVLLDERQQPTTFAELLAQNKAKVIYVDFWASWCAPCRQAMPESHKMQEAFRGKDVVFVYLALNDRYESWQKAVKEEGLEGYPYSFLIENPKTAKMLEDLEVNAIPRYLIYGKDGRLAHRNAPGPGEEARRLMLGL
ncbi:MAG TPA: TlpA disulfide reductase family protein [Flavilitoribacter sp.]|nr:TlpA disulfide reductase family protein [Flavilitoribacter sp.]